MPNAGKLVAGILFALIAYACAEVFKPELPEGTPVKWFSEMNGAIGFLVGWWVMGGSVGTPIKMAAWRGVMTSVLLLFWADLAFSLRDMLIHSTRMTYKTPTQAILAVFDNFLQFGLMALTLPVLTILLVGGLVSGILAEGAFRRWG